jgi:hypothetical protein
MSGGQRHTEPVDVHLILRRESAGGPQVLLSRRAGQVYAASLWHLPSVHLDGPHEDVVTALIREAREPGVVIDPADVQSVVTNAPPQLGPLLEAVGKAVLAVPDAYATTTVDVTPWLEHKWKAVLAHRGEVARERSLPGIRARLPEEARRGIIATEYFTRLATGPLPIGSLPDGGQPPHSFLDSIGPF